MPIRVEERISIAASPQAVWDAIVDWERQNDWIPFTVVRREPGGPGVGERFVAVTKVGPVGFADPMEVIGWQPPERADVRHLGRVVRGTGTFEVRPRGASASTFVWTESLDLPLGRLGRLGWPLVRPAMVAGVRLSLKRFAAYAEAHPA